MIYVCLIIRHVQSWWSIRMGNSGLDTLAPTFQQGFLRETTLFPPPIIETPHFLLLLVLLQTAIVGSLQQIFPTTVSTFWIRTDSSFFILTDLFDPDGLCVGAKDCLLVAECRPGEVKKIKYCVQAKELYKHL